jgi:DNA-binding beta-propeller fold protein YncE
VDQFTTGGTFLGTFHAATLGGVDIEVDAIGQLWVADYYHNMLRAFTAAGVPVDSLGSAGSGPGEFIGAIGHAVGPDGSIYVADESNMRVQRFIGPAASVSPESEASAPHAGGPRPAIRSITPNPCRTGTQLAYSLPNEEHVQVSIVDVQGRIVTTLAEGRVAPGMHRIPWAARNADGQRLAAGGYFVRLAHGQGVDVARLIVVR